MEPPDERARPWARVRSWLGDWAVVAGWLVLLGLLSFFFLDGFSAPPEDPPSAAELLPYDLLIAVATVIPFLLYLVVTESSASHASLGKRWNHLTVRSISGAAPSRRSVWVRNLVKVLPWQLAHLAVSRFILDTQLSTAIVFDVGALALLGLIAAPALTGGQGLHDRLAGTVVTRVPR